LKLIAFQVGSEVSQNELATQVKLDVKTVGRYLDILEKAFVIVRVGGFSRNLRNEVTSKAKYYFLDNGVRNAVIGQYNLLDSRNDVGALWENFLVAERLKKRSYTGIYGTFHFWRTYDGKRLTMSKSAMAGCSALSANGRQKSRTSRRKSGWSHIRGRHLNWLRRITISILWDSL